MWNIFERIFCIRAQHRPGAGLFSESNFGANGEADFHEMFVNERGTCNKEFAVFCVQTGL